MAARPRGAVRALDAQVHLVEAGVVGARSAGHTLEPPTGHAGDGGRGEASSGRPAAARRPPRPGPGRAPDQGGGAGPPVAVPPPERLEIALAPGSPRAPGPDGQRG